MPPQLPKSRAPFQQIFQCAFVGLLASVENVDVVELRQPYAADGHAEQLVLTASPFLAGSFLSDFFHFQNNILQFFAYQKKVIILAVF